VKAIVQVSNGKSSLGFESTTTGENSQLSVDFGNDLNNKMNVKSIQEGKNAKYKVNNVEYSSESNSVNLSNKVKASLNSVGKAEVSANNINSKSIVDAVKTFAYDYNKVVDFLSKNSTNSTNIKNIDSSFERITYNSSSLSSIGITVGFDGKLSVNENNLIKSASDNYKNVENILGSSSGIAYQSCIKAQNSINNSSNAYSSIQSNSSNKSRFKFNNYNSIFSQYRTAYSRGLFLNSSK
jgi:flagellar hook-associated protein 2